MGKYIANKNPLQHSNHSAQHNIIFVGICCSKPCDKIKDLTRYKLSLKYHEQVLSVHYLRAFEGKKATLKQKSATESNRASATEALGRD